MPRVLVCESERHISRLLQVNLERQGHTVQITGDGEACLRSLRQTSAQLLIIGEPVEVTANDLLAEIQADPEIDVKVIVLRKKPHMPDPPEGPFGGSPPIVVSTPNAIGIHLVRCLGG